MMESKIRLPQLKNFRQSAAPPEVPSLNIQLGDENTSKNTSPVAELDGNSVVHKTIQMYNHMKSQSSLVGNQGVPTIVSKDSAQIELQIDLAKNFYDVKSLWDPSGPLTYRNGKRSQHDCIDMEPFTCSCVMDIQSNSLKTDDGAAAVITCEELIACPMLLSLTAWTSTDDNHGEDIGIYDGSDLTQAISVPEKETNNSVHGESVVSLASSRSQDICDAGMDGEKPDCVVQLLQELGLQDIIPNFELRRIGLQELSRMSDNDLKLLGIDKLGKRVKLRQRAQLLVTSPSKVESLSLYGSSSSSASSLPQFDEIKSSLEIFDRRQSYEILDAIDHDLQVEQIEDHPLNNLRSLIMDVETKWKQALVSWHVFLSCCTDAFLVDRRGSNRPAWKQKSTKDNSATRLFFYLPILYKQIIISMK
ncbi:hypothetical protein GUITHDRAFT_99160 [Guillardia theta CCMP2712]|uniref:SAM domain-containing protein n=1 Tax=Guillardia theta (strain CCMP2712) TaxID=905079 RepID=L1K479_GUITC|nr:hypothetical protein GUITHDRAFT_99160 [Guillardia theta CCMP2712]EKX55377.1 hypothetical protein GUITHDRAFT_99160 [Guillardia theta CCMP2712]|eukprot:XP_005842357.1 hypothetical protein GUITHDRAFT_99160 [Guillardia theta CCMP2712]